MMYLLLPSVLPFYSAGVFSVHSVRDCPCWRTEPWSAVVFVLPCCGSQWLAEKLETAGAAMTAAMHNERKATKRERGKSKAVKAPTAVFSSTSVSACTISLDLGSMHRSLLRAHVVLALEHVQVPH